MSSHYPELTPDNAKIITDFFARKSADGWFLHKESYSYVIKELSIKRKYEKLQAKALYREGVSTSCPSYPTKTKLKIRVLEDVFEVMKTGSASKWRTACIQHNEMELKQLAFSRLTHQQINDLFGINRFEHDNNAEYTVCALRPKAPRIQIHYFIPKNHVIYEKELEAAFQITLYYGIILNKDLLSKLKQRVYRYGPAAAHWFGYSDGYTFDF